MHMAGSVGGGVRLSRCVGGGGSQTFQCVNDCVGGIHKRCVPRPFGIRSGTGSLLSMDRVPALKYHLLPSDCAIASIEPVNAHRAADRKASVNAHGRRQDLGLKEQGSPGRWDL
jgi:hypothetical protein